MKPKLILQPIHESSANILKSFLDSKPLSTDQLHFLEWHQIEFSNAWYDPILRYYLEPRRRRRQQFQGSFLLPHEQINLEAIQSLKKRILASLKNKFDSAVITISQKQFLDFKHYTAQELIFWHGNQFLTNAPFYPSCIPPVIYFQWGNFFGIVKYMVLPEEKNLKANILIYFEDMQDRDLDRCVADYQERLQQNIQLQNEIVSEKKLVSPKIIINPTEEKEEEPTPSNYFLLHHL